MTNTIGSF